MTPRFVVPVLLAVLSVTTLSAQWSVHVHLNEYYPLGNPLKGYYPMLWYSSADGRGVLFGGFGAGVSYRQARNEQFGWTYQLNVQRSRYYAEPFSASDDNGQSLGFYLGINTHVAATGLAMAEWRPDAQRRLALSGGLGIRGVLFSRADYGSIILLGRPTELKLTDRSLRPLVGLVPLGISYRIVRGFSLAARSEWLVTRASRLDARAGERGVIAYLEAAYAF